MKIFEILKEIFVSTGEMFLDTVEGMEIYYITKEMPADEVKDQIAKFVEDTQWSIEYEDQLEYYLGKGNIYILIGPQGDKYLFHFESKTFVDADEYSILWPR